MAIGQYEIWIDHWDGTRLVNISDWLRLNYTRALHSVGVLDLLLPSSFDVSYLQEDYKIEIWRTVANESQRLENIYLIRGWRPYTDANGVNYTKITGVDGNDILKRRFVYADPESTEAKKTGLGGNLCRRYMRDAILKADRYSNDSPDERGDISDYVTVEANQDEWIEYQSTPASWATEVSKFTENREWQTLLDTCNGICERSTGRGYPIWWYMFPVDSSEYQFRAYKTLFGNDLTSSVILQAGTGMSQAEDDYDAVDEFTNIVCGGQLLEPSGSIPLRRITSQSYNDLRFDMNPFAYREKFIDMGEEPSSSDLHDRAVEELESDENRPTRFFTGNIIEYEGFRYGRDWDLGDKISFNYRTLQGEATIKLVNMRVEKTEQVWTALNIEIEVEASA